MLLGEITPTSLKTSADCCNLRALDKDLTTATAVKTDNGNGELWLKVEFDKTHFIDKVVIYYMFYTNWFDSGWCQESVSNFKACVDKSNNVDVSVYQGEVKQKDCSTLQLTYGLEQSDQIYTLPCNVEGDTVKLIKPSSGEIRVFEIVVIGTTCK